MDFFCCGFFLLFCFVFSLSLLLAFNKLPAATVGVLPPYLYVTLTYT